MLGVLPTKPNGKVDFSGTNISGDENDALGGTDVTGSWSFTAEGALKTLGIFIPGLTCPSLFYK